MSEIIKTLYYNKLLRELQTSNLSRETMFVFCNVVTEQAEKEGLIKTHNDSGIMVMRK